MFKGPACAKEIKAANASVRALRDERGRSVTYLLIQRFKEGTAITEQNERAEQKAKGLKG